MDPYGYLSKATGEAVAKAANKVEAKVEAETAPSPMVW